MEIKACPVTGIRTNAYVCCNRGNSRYGWVRRIEVHRTHSGKYVNTEFTVEIEEGEKPGQGITLVYPSKYVSLSNKMPGWLLKDKSNPMGSW